MRLFAMRQMGSRTCSSRRGAELACVGAEGWATAVDGALAVDPPDVLATASVVDAAYRTHHGEPLEVDADIAHLVLLAPRCCVDADASDVDPARSTEAS